MAAEGMQFSWWWDSGTISTNLDVIWGMSQPIEKIAMRNAPSFRQDLSLMSFQAEVNEAQTSSVLRAHILAENIRLPRQLRQRSLPSIWMHALLPYCLIALSLSLSRLSAFPLYYLLPIHFLLFLAAHRLFSQNLKRNDFLANILVGGWIGMTVQAYRAIHFMHHAYNGSDQDPEHIDFETTRQKGGLPLHILRYVLCLEAVRLVKKYYWPSKGAVHEVAEQDSFSKDSPLQKILGKWHIAVDQLILLGLCHFVANAWYHYLLWAYLAVSWSPLLSSLRFLVEHPGKSDLTVSTTSWLFEKLYFAPYHFNYHLAHHLWPSIPPYQLKKAHRFLVAEGYFERHPECLNETYIGSLAQRHRGTDKS
jgi:fatty acid desaturase